MKRHIISVLLIMTTSLVGNFLSGQSFDPNLNFSDSTQIHLLETNKGDIFIGKTISIKNTSISFLFNKTDTLDFQLKEIKSISIYNPSQPSTKEEKENVVTSEKEEDIELIEEYEVIGTEHIFFGPSAYLSPKRHGEYRNIGVLINSVNFGISDNISIGADLSSSILRSLMSVKTKIGFPLTKHLQFAVGGRAHYGIGGFSSDFSHHFNSFYGVISFGNKEKFGNISLGYISKKNAFLMEGTYFSAGVSWRIAEQWKLLGDYFYTGVGEEKEQESITFFEDFWEKHPSSNLFLGASFFGHIHRIDFGLKITDKVRFGARIVTFVPLAAYGLNF